MTFRSILPGARRICSRSLLLGVAFLRGIAIAGEPPAAPHPDERDGTATLIHRADVIKSRGTDNAATTHLWPLYSSAESRMNYVEVAGRTGMHFHPDADHKLYVLEGNVVVTAGTNTMTAIAGDLIIIPKGIRHFYDVPAKGDRALLLTFDAPPYDPRKTVSVEPATRAVPDGPRKQTKPQEPP